MAALERTPDPFERLAEILGDLTFDRSLRAVAEREALDAARGRWEGRRAGGGPG